MTSLILIAQFESRRHEVATLAFENYRFDQVVESCGGWESQTPGDERVRPVYLENADNPDGPTLRAHFVVRFYPGTVVIQDVYAHLEGDEIGAPGESPNTREELAHALLKIPSREDEQGVLHIEAPFLHFRAGTDCREIQRWIEAQHAPDKTAQPPAPAGENPVVFAVTLKVRLKLEIPPGADFTHIINELDYEFSDTTGEARITGTEILDYSGGRVG